MRENHEMDARNGASRPWGGALASLLSCAALAACGKAAIATANGIVRAELP